MNVQLGGWQFIKSHKIQPAAARVSHLTISNHYSFFYHLDFMTKSLFVVFLRSFPYFWLVSEAKPFFIFQSISRTTPFQKKPRHVKWHFYDMWSTTYLQKVRNSWWCLLELVLVIKLFFVLKRAGFFIIVNISIKKYHDIRQILF